MFTSAASAQEVPTPDDSFEVEPPFLVSPELPESDESAPESQTQPLTLEQLKKQLESAKKSAASALRLVKAGVLAKVEAEQRTLRVPRLEAEVANAELAALKEQVAAETKRFQAGEIGEDALRPSLLAVADATAAAEKAQAAYEEAELDLAALNVRRQKQLLAAGCARKSDVARAEEKLAALQRGKEGQP